MMDQATGTSSVSGDQKIAGLLLTGGSSRRMGTDKALLIVEGERLASRLGHILSLVTQPVVEVGPGWSGLDSVRENPSGSGPLAAIAAGCTRLRQLGYGGPALVVACDLPLLTAPLLAFLANWPGGSSVLPVVEGQAQPLCARWSAPDLDAADVLVKAGQQSLRSLPVRTEAVLLDRSMWPEIVDEQHFRDVDTPEDFIALCQVADPKPTTRH